MHQIAAVTATAAIALLAGCTATSARVEDGPQSSLVGVQVAARAADVNQVGGAPAGTRTGYDPLRYAYWGLPTTGPANTELTVLFNQGYASGWDHAAGRPAWAAYRLFRSAASPGWGALESRNWQPDARLAGAATAPALAADARNRDEALRIAGLYGRDALPHQLAPYGSITAAFGAAAGDETLLRSNFFAGPASRNRPAWDALQEHEWTWAQTVGELWVVCGPLGGSKDHPEAVWKIQTAVLQGRTEVQAFIIPVAADQPEASRDGARTTGAERFLTTVGEIETRTGLTFYAGFHDNHGDTAERLRVLKPAALWK